MTNDIYAVFAAAKLAVESHLSSAEDGLEVLALAPDERHPRSIAFRISHVDFGAEISIYLLSSSNYCELEILDFRTEEMHYESRDFSDPTQVQDILDAYCLQILGKVGV